MLLIFSYFYEVAKIKNANKLLFLVSIDSWKKLRYCFCYPFTMKIQFNWVIISGTSWLMKNKQLRYFTYLLTHEHWKTVLL